MPPLTFGSLPLEVHLAINSLPLEVNLVISSLLLKVHLAISSLLIQLPASFLRSPTHLIQASSDIQSLKHNRNSLHRNEKSRRDGNDKTYGFKARTPTRSCRNFNYPNRHHLILLAAFRRHEIPAAGHGRSDIHSPEGPQHQIFRNDTPLRPCSQAESKTISWI